MDKQLRYKSVAIGAVYIIASLCPLSSYSQTAEPYWQKYKTAQTLANKKKYQQALGILLNLESEQKNFNVYLLIAESYSALNDPQSALSYYKKAYDLYKDIAPETDKKLLLFGIARTQLALKNGREAQTYYKLLLTYNLSADEQTLVDNNLKISVEELKKQEFTEAIQQARMYIDEENGVKALQLIKPLLEHNTATVYLLAGNSYALMEQPQTALEYFNQALKLAQSENNITLQQIILFATARTQIALKKPADAQSTYQKIKELQPNKQIPTENIQQLDNLNIEIELQQIKELVNKGESQKANQLIQPYLKYPLVTVNLLKGDILASLNEPKDALVYYNKTLTIAKSEKNTTYEHIALFAIARMELALRNDNQAEQIYQQLLSIKLSDTDRKVALEGLKRAEFIKQEDNFNTELTKIQATIDKGQGKKAQQLVTPLLTTHKTARVFLLAAQSNALLNNPKSALNYYELAYSAAKKENVEVLQRIALFGIARTQLALNQPKEAQKTYLQILKIKLQGKDKILAQQGLNKSKYVALLQTIYWYIHAGEGWKAYELTLPLIKNNQAIYYILAAQSMISINNPIAALNFYKTAYQVAIKDNQKEKQIEALTGIANMQMWLDYYVRATKTYRMLLTYSLGLKDYELDKAGLVKSLAYRDNTYAAYNEIPWDIHFTSPDMVIAALQTTLWLGQGDLSKKIYSDYQSILKKIKPGSHHYNDLKNIEWQLCLETAPYQIKPDVYYFQDSENFIIQRDKLGARRYWSQYWQSRLALSYLKYAQNGETIKGTSFLINQTWKPSRYLNFSAEAAPTQLNNHWDPILWNVTGSYSPNDFISFFATTAKELVEGFAAITHDISLNSYILGGILKPLPYVRVVGSSYQYGFSDNNTRKGFNVLGTVTVLPQMGIYTGYRIRNYSSAFKSPYYFSPNQYKDNVYILGISHKIATTWRYFWEGGYGDQTIKIGPDTPSGTAPSWFYKVGLRGPISPCIFLDVQYGDYQQASAFVDSTNYRFHEILASLTFSFD